MAIEALQAGLIHQSWTPRQDGIVEELVPTLSSTLAAHWQNLGFENLYFHQSDAINYAKSGHVFIATGTSSGKTACFAAPIYECLLNEPMARALVLYPTKALAQDQSSRFERFSPSQGIRVGVYDGDTPTRQRGQIRKSAQIILTNPDMLHVGILPNHENWASFFRNLRYVVLDEVHTFRGVFGMHMEWVIRRLARICEAYGSDPILIGASATLGNPDEFFGAIGGVNARCVTHDTSPQGEKHLWTWVSPEGAQVSSYRMASEILAVGAHNGLRSIAFCRSRLGVEIVLKHVRERLRQTGGDPAWAESYRAGYTPDERRAIEKAIREGQTRSLVATSAMELGVDIGDLDVAVINGFPGTIASFRQQSGRAGRAGRDGLTIFVAQEDPLDHWLANEQDLLLHANPEVLPLPRFNPNIARSHFLCMAFERPMRVLETEIGECEKALAAELAAEGQLHLRTGFFYYPQYTSPAPQVLLRSVGGTSYEIWEGTRQLGTMEGWRAFQSAFPGAIYLHRGESYEVKKLDLEQSKIEVELCNADYSTQSLVQNVVTQTANLESKALGLVSLSLSAVAVISAVHAYERRDFGQTGPCEMYPVNLPTQSMDTVGVIWQIPIEDEDDLEEASAIHGFEHALTHIAPAIANCDRNDLGSSWMLGSETRGIAIVTLFDRCPGGLGLSERLFRHHQVWIDASLRLLERCPCELGCPRCLYRPGCESSNEHLSKALTLRLLHQIQKSVSSSGG